MKGLRLLSGLVAPFGPTDEQLMWRVGSADDHAAFATLVDRWRHRLHSLCGRMLGDPALGEDVTQMAFLRVFERRHDYRPTARFSTYLWRVALNLCHDELRRRNGRPRRVRSGAADPSVDAAHDGTFAELPESVCSPLPGPDQTAARAEEGELVRRAMMGLSDALRTVVVLRHYQGLKLREIAEVLEIPEGTVNSRMAEALNRLARELGPLVRGGLGTAPDPFRRVHPHPSPAR